jgi:hypothetical protein
MKPGRGDNLKWLSILLGSSYISENNFSDPTYMPNIKTHQKALKTLLMAFLGGLMILDLFLA